MATPTSASASTAPSDPVTAPPPTASSHPLPKPFLPSSTITTSSSPHRPSPLFSAQPLVGRPINPNPNPNPSPTPPPPPRGILYPVSHRGGFPPRPASAAADQAVTVANPAGYMRNATPTSVMTFSAAGASHPRTLVYGGTHVATRPQQPAPPFAVPRPVAPSGGAAMPHPHKGVPVSAQAKVSSLPAVVPSNLEYNNSKERDRNREDTVVMINDRKVRLVDGGSGSLYALCRSWVRNGLPHETQPSFGNGEPLLPRPLPASVVGINMLRDHGGDDKDDDPIKEEHEGSLEQLSTHDLLEGHIKHAKRIRAQLRKKRLLRIERYKQRLSLLLPPPSELGRNEAAPGS
ncbi:uncharacterized protein [Typha angustifolia]|uniref:uncharacterized protein isoform X2 n=1 Tax=Typha angustifolia TaxID=59011 RepID=UPI003C2CE2AF